MTTQPREIRTEREGSIDHHYDGEEYLGSSCGRCGSSAFSVSTGCWYCGGGEDDETEEAGDWPRTPCPECQGSGSLGGYACCATPEWCAAHPMPGREDVKSTAMSSEAWRDYD